MDSPISTETWEGGKSVTLADDIISELNTSWNSGTITKPTMYNGEQKQPNKSVPLLWIMDGKADSEPKAMNQAALISTPFNIKGKASSDANALATMNEIKRIIKAKSITGGWWEIVGEDMVEREGFTAIELDGVQIQWSA